MIHEKEYFSSGAFMAKGQARLKEPAKRLSSEEFRRALGQFPTGVTIVTAAVGERLAGMTANSFSSVSLDPPLVLWSVAKTAPSYPAFLDAEAFAIHFLGADHHDLALRFAGKASDKFAGMRFTRGETGAPLLDGLAPIVECRAWARYEGGDHTILVGEVVHLVSQAHDPLLFHSGVLRRIEGGMRRARELPHDSFAKTYLAYLLARASHIVSGEFHEALRQWRLSVPEWRVLACLCDAEGLGVSELAAMAIMKQPRMTKLLDRLEAEGLVERRPDPHDRRRVLIHPTGEGRKRVAPALEAAKVHEARVLAPFTGEERAVIKHALDLLIGRGEKSAD
jgi:flavin reductase (DIM6/NTAB) family NADH-FMN oxidoreductase RutF/DNA-binding MarR family transcriptional regulator